MSASVNALFHAGYGPSMNCLPGGDKTEGYIQKLLARNGFTGNIELSRDEDGQFRAATDHPQKAAIEALLNKDQKLSAMPGRTGAGGRKAAPQDGAFYENEDGDTVFISGRAASGFTRKPGSYVGQAECSLLTTDQFRESETFQAESQKWQEQEKQHQLQVNYTIFADPLLYHSTTGYAASQSGMKWFDNTLGFSMPLGKGKSWMQPGNHALLQEYDVLESASAKRKQVYGQLQLAMKQAGIVLKEGQKADFIMDEKGAVRIDPKSQCDKNAAAKIERLISQDSRLRNSFTALLSQSDASRMATPASMRMHADTVLREYTGLGFDDLQWDASGSLVTPEGFESAIAEYGNFGYVVGHLKYLQETEGDEIFKKEYSFSVTGSGIIDKAMHRRASTNLFDKNKMLEDTSSYTEVAEENSFHVALMPKEDHIRDFWKMESLHEMINARGTSLLLTARPENNYALGPGGQRQELPYQSQNITAAAKYLIEDYLIENGIAGDISDYALRINSKGNYEIVPLSSSGNYEKP